MAIKIKTEELDQYVLDREQQMQAYCGLDNCITWEVESKMLGQLEPDTTAVTYDFMRAMQGPALAMMRRGFAVDHEQVAKVLDGDAEATVNLDEVGGGRLFSTHKEARLDAQKRRQGLRARLYALGGMSENPQKSGPKNVVTNEEALLQRIAIAAGFGPINYNSGQQIAALLYDTLFVPPVYKRDGNGRKRTVEHDALEKLMERYPRATLICLLLLRIREISKMIQVLETQIDDDGRFRYSIKVAGTETGRFSSSSTAFNTGCVPASAEVLTREGWIKIKDFDDKKGVALQWEPCSQKLKWLPARLHKSPGNGTLLAYTSEQIKLSVTEDHRIPHFGPKNLSFKVDIAEDLYKRSRIYLPVAGQIEQEGVQYPRLLVALMADGSKEGNLWRLMFKRDRKKFRIEELLNSSGFDWWTNKTKEGYTRYVVRAPMDFPKRWGPWIFNCSNLDELVDEAKHWDSHVRGDSFIFWTSRKEEAEWFQTAAHLTNRGTTIGTQQNGGKCWSTTLMYKVNVKPRNYVQVLRKHWDVEPYDAPVYCLNTLTGFWLVRYHNNISITGNSNIQNVTPEVRRMFVSDPGRILVNVDLEQAESRAVAYLSGDEKFIKACESGDLHTAVAQMVFGVKNREEAEQLYYRHFTYRDMAKRAGHGLNYGLTPHSLARHMKISVAQAYRVYLLYLGGELPLNKVLQHGLDDMEYTREGRMCFFPGAFPGIKEWHESTRMELETEGVLITPLARKRTFWGRLSDSGTLREAIAYRPQSTIADLLNAGLWRIWREYENAGIELIAQVHDSIVMQVDEKKLDSLLPRVLELMMIPVPINGRKMVVPIEAKLGRDWRNLTKWKA